MSHPHIVATNTHAKPRLINLSSADDAVALYQKIWDQTVNQGEVLEPLQALAQAFGYSIDPVMLDVVDLSLSELQKISRFGGNENTAPSRKGNTAQHVLQGTLVACYDLVDEFREILFPPQIGRRFWAEYNHDQLDHMVRYIPDMIDSVFMEYLSHDDGEKLFEPASVTQNVTQNIRKSWPTLERRVAHFGVALAFYAHENFSTREEKRKFYAGVFREIRTPAKEYYDRKTAELREGKADPALFADDVTRHIISSFIQPQENKYQLGMVARANHAFISQYLSHYDLPEGFSPAGGFTGLYTKIGQKNHSVMHINEHHGKDGSAPHEHTTSILTVASLGYAEAMLPQIFAEAAGGDLIHRRAALRTARRIYETNLQMTKMMPIVIDLDKEAAKKESAPSSPARMQEISKLAEIATGGGGLSALHKLPAHETPGSLRTCFQLQARYQAALAELSANPNFQPPEKPFYALEKVDTSLARHIGGIDPFSLTLYSGPDQADLSSFIRGRWLGYNR